MRSSDKWSKERRAGVERTSVRISVPAVPPSKPLRAGPLFGGDGGTVVPGVGAPPGFPDPCGGSEAWDAVGVVSARAGIRQSALAGAKWRAGVARPPPAGPRRTPPTSGPGWGEGGQGTACPG